MSGLRILIAAALLTGASAGRATVLINAGDIGTAIQVDYLGTVLGLPVSGLGAIGNFVYTGTSNEGRSYNFSYALTNDSTTTSRVRSFGFDVLGDTPVSLSSTGTYANPIQNPLSALLGTDVCFTVATLGGCSSGSGGVSAGQSASGTFALNFGQAMAAVELGDFGVNFQGVGGLFAGSGTGNPLVTPATGAAVPAVPESESWVMMILGFGLIGGLLRRPKPWATIRGAAG